MQVRNQTGVFCGADGLHVQRGACVNENQTSLQGEGAQAGRPAVFCRFSGYNLWSGHEEDRPDAVCDFCDTDFVGTNGPGGAKHSSAIELAHAIDGQWPSEPPGSDPVPPYLND